MSPSYVVTFLDEPVSGETSAALSQSAMLVLQRLTPTERRVALLVASTRDKAAETDPRSFNLLGTIVGPSNDGRLRRVVTLTISLRNRLP